MVLCITAIGSLLRYSILLHSVVHFAILRNCIRKLVMPLFVQDKFSCVTLCVLSCVEVISAHLPMSHRFNFGTKVISESEKQEFSAACSNSAIGRNGRKTCIKIVCTLSLEANKRVKGQRGKLEYIIAVYFDYIFTNWFYAIPEGHYFIYYHRKDPNENDIRFSEVFKNPGFSMYMEHSEEVDPLTKVIQ